MPSPKIISSCAQIVQSNLLPNIPSKWRHQFEFGIQAFTLTRNNGLAEGISAAVCDLGLIKPASIVACNHSDFNGLSAFVGAVQTKKGRAVPCLIDTTYSLGLPAHDQPSKRKQALRQARKEPGETLYEHAAVALEAFAVHLGFWPRLVFDRGFGGKDFVRTLVRHQATFYVRLKAGRLVELGAQRRRVSELSAVDERIQLAGMSLRIIRSTKTKQGEPWYILTSDIASSRNKIIQIYYHRFEIEETFKDLKHVLELHQTKLLKPLSLKVLL